VRVLLDSQYLPSIAYFVPFSLGLEVVIDAHEFFEKQSYRNRCHILTAQGVQRLSVPVLHGKDNKTPLHELQIDYKQKWMNNHWRAIQTAYGKAPFFDYYAEAIQREIYAKHQKLYTINTSLLTICLDMLQIRANWQVSEQWIDKPGLADLDLRSAIHPKKSIDNLTWFQPLAYYQVFGSNFAANLSILDLLFSMGPEASGILKQSGTFLQNN